MFLISSAADCTFGRLIRGGGGWTEVQLHYIGRKLLEIMYSCNLTNLRRLLFFMTLRLLTFSYDRQIVKGTPTSRCARNKVLSLAPAQFIEKRGSLFFRQVPLHLRSVESAAVHGRKVEIARFIDAFSIGFEGVGNTSVGSLVGVTRRRNGVKFIAILHEDFAAQVVLHLVGVASLSSGLGVPVFEELL